MPYKSKLKTILMVYQNEIRSLEQNIATELSKLQACEEKLAYERQKEELLRKMLETGEAVDSSFFLSAFSSSYEFNIKQEMEVIHAEIRTLNRRRHEVTKKKDWVLDEDKKREALFLKEELRKEERRTEGDEGG